MMKLLKMKSHVVKTNQIGDPEESYDDVNGNNLWDSVMIWNPEESYDDLNENGQWDAVYEELYNFDKASINPSPFVLVPSANEVLDFPYSFPSNSRLL